MQNKRIKIRSIIAFITTTIMIGLLLITGSGDKTKAGYEDYQPPEDELYFSNLVVGRGAWYSSTNTIFEATVSNPTASNLTANITVKVYILGGATISEVTDTIQVNAGSANISYYSQDLRSYQTNPGQIWYFTVSCDQINKPIVGNMYVWDYNGAGAYNRVVPDRLNIATYNKVGTVTPTTVYARLTQSVASFDYTVQAYIGGEFQFEEYYAPANQWIDTWNMVPDNYGMMSYNFVPKSGETGHQVGTNWYDLGMAVSQYVYGDVEYTYVSTRKAYETALVGTNQTLGVSYNSTGEIPATGTKQYWIFDPYYNLHETGNLTYNTELGENATDYIVHEIDESGTWTAIIDSDDVIIYYGTENQDEVEIDDENLLDTDGDGIPDEAEAETPEPEGYIDQITQDAEESIDEFVEGLEDIWRYVFVFGIALTLALIMYLAIKDDFLSQAGAVIVPSIWIGFCLVKGYLENWWWIIVALLLVLLIWKIIKR